MPKFILRYGTADAVHTFDMLDAFTQGYVEAMFFTECHSDNPELDSATVAELAAEAIGQIKIDCDTFQLANKLLLSEAYAIGGRTLGRIGTYDEAAAGRDFWYTRNGHGTGFWDSGLGECGDLLAKACRGRSVDLYRGDDGLLYLA